LEWRIEQATEVNEHAESPSHGDLASMAKGFGEDSGSGLTTLSKEKPDELQFPSSVIPQEMGAPVHTGCPVQTFSLFPSNPTSGNDEAQVMAVDHSERPNAFCVSFINEKGLVKQSIGFCPKKSMFQSISAR
jgi:hypothetical protein